MKKNSRKSYYFIEDFRSDSKVMQIVPSTLIYCSWLSSVKLDESRVCTKYESQALVMLDCGYLYSSFSCPSTSIPLIYHYLSYPILFYPILFYSILFYSILFYSILFYSILFYRIISYRTVSYRIISHGMVWYRIVSYLLFSNLSFTFLILLHLDVN